MRTVRYFFLILVLTFSFLVAQKKEFSRTKLEYNPKTYVAFKAEQRITIDGKIDEKSWDSVNWTDSFVDIEGELKPLPFYSTRVKMIWDEEYFYFAAEFEEPHIWAKLKQRDTVIYKDNDFEIFIDPDSDTHNYYEYEVNAFGTEWDLFLTKPYRDGARALNAFDFPGLKTGIHINGTLNDPSDIDKGWTIEVAIPWKTFKGASDTHLPPKDEDQWRVNFSRVQYNINLSKNRYSKKKDSNGKDLAEMNWVWSPQGLIAMHAPETWGIVQFSKSNPNSNVEFKFQKDEEARWALRELYYQQKTYSLNHAKYSNNISNLEMPELKLKNYEWPPVIEATTRYFNASIKSLDGKETWFIENDGRIWKEGL